MRISDWSSDVCSSDLPTTAYPVIFFSILTAMTRFLVFVFVGLGAGGHVAGGAGEERDPHPNPSPALRERDSSWLLLFCGLARGLPGRGFLRGLARGGLFGCRSAEHTSELQSLMRISYAVFCLKTKNSNNINTQP